MRALIFVLLFIALPALAAPGDLERVSALIKGGALQLALHQCDRFQPSPKDTENWIAWEKQRYAVFFSQRNWDALARRIKQMPEGLPSEFVRWAKTQGARARLFADDADGARQILRELLWSDAEAGAYMAEWRLLVIRSYLIEDKLHDAQLAVVRYKQDHPGLDDSWRILHAHLLIRSAQYRHALDILAGQQSFEARMLQQVAQLRGKTGKPAAILAEAKRLVHDTRNKPPLHYQAWALTAEAARRAGERLEEVIALERALSLKSKWGKTERLYQADAAQLWTAYDAYAEAYGNKERLLIGNDGAWLKQAESFKRDDAPQARAFYAFLATRASDDRVQQLAHDRLAASLAEDGRGEVLRALYLDTQRYAQLDAVPAAVRHVLLDTALADYDIQSAAQILSGLEAPPKASDQDRWNLKRARVMIYAGEADKAMPLLSNMLANKDKLDDDLAERYIQVMFDLQGSERAREAAVLLDSLYPLVDNDRLRREILFWQADSWAAVNEHARAAELYLRSATYDNHHGGDLWGQSARYHAAQALGKAGMVDDARGVYQRLLEFNNDPKQRLLIERQLQQLWLVDKKTITR